MAGAPGAAGQDTPGDVHVRHRRLHPERHRGLEHLARAPGMLLLSYCHHRACTLGVCNLPLTVTAGRVRQDEGVEVVTMVSWQQGLSTFLVQPSLRPAAAGTSGAQ